MTYPTRRQVREFIRQSNKIEGITSEREVVQSELAWDFLIEQSVLTPWAIKKVQKIITINQEIPPYARGYYRGEIVDTEVTVGGRFGARSALVPSLMSNWLLDFTELGWKAAHIRFEHIHPFIDGNGRTGRMVMNWQRLKLEDLPLLTIYSRDKQKYYDWFKEVK